MDHSIPRGPNVQASVMHGNDGIHGQGRQQSLKGPEAVPQFRTQFATFQQFRY